MGLHGPGASRNGAGIRGGAAALGGRRAEPAGRAHRAHRRAVSRDSARRDLRRRSRSQRRARHSDQEPAHIDDRAVDVDQGALGQRAWPKLHREAARANPSPPRWRTAWTSRGTRPCSCSTWAAARSTSPCWTWASDRRRSRTVPAGDAHLGGDDLDRALALWLAKEAKALGAAVDPRGALQAAARARALSGATEVVPMPGAGDEDAGRGRCWRRCARRRCATCVCRWRTPRRPPAIKPRGAAGGEPREEGRETKQQKNGSAVRPRAFSGRRDQNAGGASFRGEHVRPATDAGLWTRTRSWHWAPPRTPARWRA